MWLYFKKTGIILEAIGINKYSAVCKKKDGTGVLIETNRVIGSRNSSILILQ